MGFSYPIMSHHICPIQCLIVCTLTQMLLLSLFPLFRKDKCSLMWRMVGCGFLPTNQKWNSLENFHWKLIWETLLEYWLKKRTSSAIAIIVESVSHHIFFQFTLLLNEQPFSWLKQIILPLYLLLCWGWIWKSTFLENLYFLCSIILHCRLWSLQIMIILSFCIWSHANMNRTLHLYLVPIILQISRIYHSSTSCTPTLII